MIDAALDEVLLNIGPVAIAVSGGVDSLTLAAAAHRLMGDAVTMHHAVSPAVPAEATRRTRALGEAEGWRLDVFDAGEFADESYLANPVNRCFFCKTNLYGTLAQRTAATLASGTNTDDLGDFRPGLDAARAYGVRHPYVEAGLSKRDVRVLAASLGLRDVAELPASPCLSSRMETGLRIDSRVLRLIEQAEQIVDDALSPLTVRCRVRAAAVVIELDEPTMKRVDITRRHRLQRMMLPLLREAGLNLPLEFAPYRTGSAFLRAAV